MALWFRLMVNDDEIGELYARRLAPTTVPAADDTICRYAWMLRGPSGTRGGDLEHRFGDGAWELVRKVIEAARARGVEAADA